MNKDLEERQLWELLCEGDQDALQKLYITYYNPLLQYGLKYSDDHDTPKDSINSTFCIYGKNVLDYPLQTMLAATFLSVINDNC